MRVFPVALLVCVAFAFSDTATQTDWSGGNGVPGPVTDWGISYDEAFQIDHDGDSMQLVASIVTGWCGGDVLPVTAPSSIYAADVDGDGDIDLLSTSAEDHFIAWFENTDGTGTVWTEHMLDADLDSASSVCATDIDGDGDTDVIGGSGDSEGVYLWENTDGVGTSWTKARVDGGMPLHQVTGVAAVDMNNDGDTDVIASNSTALGTYWYQFYPEVPGWFLGGQVSNADNVESMYISDVDSDGDLDVLCAQRFYSTYQDQIAWFENTNGTGTVWTEHIVRANYEGAASAHAADIDGDGDIDVLGAAEYFDDITWWENTDGTGTVWTEHIIDGEFSAAHAVRAVDVDLDGDMDVLGLSCASPGHLTFWENTDGTGTVWTEHPVWTFATAGSALFAADVDGNGFTDAVYAQHGLGGSVAWFGLMGYPSYGTLESSILDAGMVDSWELVAYNCDEPAGTSVGFQFRSSCDSANMGAWSDTVYASATSLSGILADSTDFMQYKVILQSSNETCTPVLNDITISYTTIVSIDENSTDVVTDWNFAPAANPSFGNCEVQVSLPQSEMVNFVLHDVTGRVIAQYSQELPSGTHSVVFNNLSEGVYFCTMRGGDFTATERIVVLN